MSHQTRSKSLCQRATLPRLAESQCPKIKCIPASTWPQYLRGSCGSHRRPERDRSRMWDDLLQPSEPAALGKFARKTFFGHADSDEGCGRCAWRGAEQGDEGFVRGCDQLDAELQYAAPLLIGLNDLDALSGDRFAPVLSSGLGKELSKSCELMCRALQDLTAHDRIKTAATRASCLRGRPLTRNMSSQLVPRRLSANASKPRVCCAMKSRSSTGSAPLRSASSCAFQHQLHDTIEARSGATVPTALIQAAIFRSSHPEGSPFGSGNSLGGYKRGVARRPGHGQEPRLRYRPLLGGS